MKTCLGATRSDGKSSAGIQGQIWRRALTRGTRQSCLGQVEPPGSRFGIQTSNLAR